MPQRRARNTLWRALTHLSTTSGRSDAAAMIRAVVVLPVPGGPTNRYAPCALGCGRARVCAHTPAYAPGACMGNSTASSTCRRVSSLPASASHPTPSTAWLRLSYSLTPSERSSARGCVLGLGGLAPPPPAPAGPAPPYVPATPSLAASSSSSSSRSL